MGVDSEVVEEEAASVVEYSAGDNAWGVDLSGIVNEEVVGISNKKVKREDAENFIVKKSRQNPEQR